MSAVKVVRVTDLAAPGANSMATGPFGSSISSKFFQSSGVPVIRGGNLSTDPAVRLSDQNLVFLDPIKAAEFSRSTVRPGDLVFTCWGTINQIGLIDESAGYDKYILSNKQMKLTPDPSIADSEFLYFLFSSPRMQQEILEGSIGSSIPGFNLTRLKSLEIDLPPLPEQQSIARALADAQHVETGLAQAISKKQAIKQGMMQRLLTGRTRLAGYNGTLQTRRLAEVLSYEQPWRYLVRTSKQLNIGRIPVLTAGKTFVLGYTNELHGVYRSHPVIIFDDFTTASKYVDFDFKAKSSALKILSARPGFDLRFIFERMQLIDFPLGEHKRHWISEYSRQEVEVPGEAEQRAISVVVADADLEIGLLTRRLAKAKAIKTGMMQELLTGQAHLSACKSVA
jgi:type I restriction enzyme, S subunit